MWISVASRVSQMNTSTPGTPIRARAQVGCLALQNASTAAAQ